MAKTKEYNPFSEELMDLIIGVYSTDTQFANESFEFLINYFQDGYATEEEINHLRSTNNNRIVELLDQLNKESIAYKLLRSTVGQVVADNLFTTEAEDDIDIAGETSSTEL